jgi:uncharacterized protein (TIGR00296 family)
MDLLSEEEGSFALKAAEIYINAAVSGLPAADPILPDSFSEKRGVFVTLIMAGELRGCIGIPYPVLPLSEALKEAAESAAVRDMRFPPVTPDELPRIRIEVTILTPPRPLTVPAEDRPSAVKTGRHGLIAGKGMQSGLLLPQVAVEYGWTAEEFLSHTCRKAGLPAFAWKEETCSIQTFEGQIFRESA